MAHTLTDEETFCLQGCGTYEKYFKMRRDFENGVCTFCELDRELNRVLWEDEHAFAWLVPTEFMQNGLAYQALFVPKRHIRFETELTDQEYLSILKAKRFMHASFQYTGGISHVREGDMRLNAGTVPHLHYNTFMPNRTAEVRIPVLKGASDRQKNRARAAVFAIRYDAGETPK